MGGVGCERTLDVEDARFEVIDRLALGPA